jgi:hypothetical protein
VKGESRVTPRFITYETQKGYGGNQNRKHRKKKGFEGKEIDIS